MGLLSVSFNWIREKIDIKPVLFALYLSAGAIKGNESSSIVDLTLLIGALLVIATLWELVKKKARVPSTLIWVLLFFVFLGWGVAMAGRTEYGTDKILRLFTLTFLAMAAPVLLFQSVEDLRKLVNAFIVISFVVSAMGLGSLGTAEAARRLTAGSANTIMTGMLAGVAVMGILVWGLEGKIWRFLLSLAGVGISSLIMLSAGSKGPIVAAGISFLYLFTVFYRKQITAVHRAITMAVLVAVVLVMAWSILPSSSVQRLTTFFSKDFEEAVAGDRVSHWSNGLAIIRNHPFGIGWGGYSTAVGAGGTRWYPHNFMLEITMEAGWGAGLFVATLIVVGLYRIIRIGVITKNEQAKMLGALLIYFVIEASFSGDINDHRWMLSILSISLACKLIFIRAQEPHELDSPSEEVPEPSY